VLGIEGGPLVSLARMPYDRKATGYSKRPSQPLAIDHAELCWPKPWDSHSFMARVRRASTLAFVSLGELPLRVICRHRRVWCPCPLLPRKPTSAGAACPRRDDASRVLRRAPHSVGRPIFPGEHIFSFGPACQSEQALQIRFMILSPTTRRSILLIRSERSTSAALMAAIVWRNVLTFDPNDTIPPSTTAIDPMAAT